MNHSFSNQVPKIKLNISWTTGSLDYLDDLEKIIGKIISVEKTIEVLPMQLEEMMNSLMDWCLKFKTFLRVHITPSVECSERVPNFYSLSDYEVFLGDEDVYRKFLYQQAEEKVRDMMKTNYQDYASRHSWFPN